ncbi:MBOAT family O-acyltransferase [Steroidobacter sp.]|uniref:MBOAT family O-acyltransferase n=1 Tax=Steroidobacter sp. TaxID=1978227 RepID=UPI001A420934|nr:MBOAT family protein [Steroidobacter sp.]MBL8269748.1 MBOAT family protein [Steroidobacter sp.]
MIFNSFIFWAFFALVLLLYWRLPPAGQNRLLLLASYVFYGYWDWRYLGLIATSTLLDYCIGRSLLGLQEARQRKMLVTLSIVINLSILGFFKYYGFFVTEFAELLRAIGFEAHLPILQIVLPVGISFYTFQSMAYVIDLYRGVTKPARSLIDYALFVSYFPQLLAGPIERSSKLLPQIQGERRYRPGDFAEGLYHILIGLFKKVIVADNLAPIANRVFETPAADLSGTEMLIGVYAFAFQIYGDFSGYSSMAQGVSKWLGIDLSYNFRMPYFSRSPSEFWQRWHISLSQWLRDYLYIPLGGNRHGPTRTQVNLLLTMLLGGLWHGANWTFIAWGAWHGLLLIAYRVAGTERFERPAPSTAVAVIEALAMFHFVCVGWIFFRAASVEQAFGMFGALGNGFAITDFAVYASSLLAFFVTPLLVYEWYVYRQRDMVLALSQPAWQRVLLYGYFVAMVAIFPPLAQQVFIYFQF